MNNQSRVSDCRLISFQCRTDEQVNHIRLAAETFTIFPIKRIYYLYDIPFGALRGGHSHKELHAIYIAAMGSFHVLIDDGAEKKEFILNRSDQGLYVPNNLWRVISQYSTGAVTLVFASGVYNENEIIRQHDNFLEYRKQSRTL